jgi:hypothetical protein
VTDHLLALRSFHNRELEEIKIFHEVFTSYIKRHIKKLSLVASELAILENINKIVICKLCGHIVRMATDKPSEIPKHYVKATGSLLSMDNSFTDLESKRPSQSNVEDEKNNSFEKSK